MNSGKFYIDYIDSIQQVALVEAGSSLIKDLKKINGDPDKLYGVLSNNIIDTTLKFINSYTGVLDNKIKDIELKIKLISALDFEIDRKKKVIDIIISDINKSFKESIDLRYIQSLIKYNTITINEPTKLFSNIIPFSLDENPFFIDMKSNLNQAIKYISSNRYTANGLDKLVDELVNIKTKYEDYILKQYGYSIEDIQNKKINIDFDRTKETYTGNLEIKKISAKPEMKYMYSIFNQEKSSYDSSKKLESDYMKLEEVLENIKVSKKEKDDFNKLNSYIVAIKDLYKIIVYTRSSIIDIIKKVIIKSVKLKLNAVNDYMSFLNYIKNDNYSNNKLSVSNKDYSIGFSSGIFKESSIIDQEDFYKIHGVPIDLDNIYDIYYDTCDNDEDRQELFSNIKKYAQKKNNEIDDEKSVIDVIKDKIIEGSFFNEDYETILQEAIVNKEDDNRARDTLKDFNDKMNELSKNLSKSMSVLFGKAKNIKNRNLITKFFIKKNLDIDSTVKNGPNIVSWIDRMTYPVPFNLNNGESIIQTINDGNAIIVENLAKNLNNFNINNLDNKESYNDLFRTWFLVCNTDKLRYMNLYREDLRYADITNETKLAMFNYITATSASIYRSLIRDMKYATNIANINMFRKVVDKIEQDRLNDHSMTAEMVNDNVEGEQNFKQKTYNINTYATKYSNLIYSYFKIKINAYYKLSKSILNMVNEYVKKSSPSFDIISQSDIADNIIDNQNNKIENNLDIT